MKTLLAFGRRAGLVRARITYTFGVVLEWVAFVLMALMAVAGALLACVLYLIILFVRRVLEGP